MQYLPIIHTVLYIQPFTQSNYRGMRANRISPWRSLLPTLQIWTDASLYGSGGKTYGGSHFQYTWSEQEKRKHINWLELRAA